MRVRERQRLQQISGDLYMSTEFTLATANLNRWNDEGGDNTGSSDIQRQMLYVACTTAITIQRQFT